MAALARLLQCGIALQSFRRSQLLVISVTTLPQIRPVSKVPSPAPLSFFYRSSCRANTMTCFKPATPGFVVTLVATVLLIFVTFGVPWIKTIYFLKATVKDLDGEILFGTFGYCMKQANGTTCSKPSVGYEIGTVQPIPNHLLVLKIDARYQHAVGKRHQDPNSKRSGQMDHILPGSPRRRPWALCHLICIRSSGTLRRVRWNMLQYMRCWLLGRSRSSRIHLRHHFVLPHQG